MADPNWTGFKPYEKYDNEVEAWNPSRSWYNQLYKMSAPLAGLHQNEIDFSTTDKTFIANKEAYQEIEEKISKALSYDKD